MKKNSIKIGQVDNKIVEQLEFKAGGNNIKYKIESVCNSTVYVKDLVTSQLLCFYHLVF